mmetsp:Transcript_51878/g.121822  ORF Transcript_51878/g.121822 Transcript_51878/m.121822 type:complete len:862 (+) Transcript_51878:241-2826(+)
MANQLRMLLGISLVLGLAQAMDNCIGLEGVIGSEARLVFGKDGQLEYTNKNSPDFFVTNVIEYSTMPTFDDLVTDNTLDRAELQNLEVAEQGSDFNVRYDPVTGDVRAGRFAFIKFGVPTEAFYFPAKGRLINGQVYYLRNFRYRAEEDCIAPPRLQHAIFPTEVAVNPPMIETVGGPSIPRNLTVLSVDTTSVSLAWVSPEDSGDGTPDGFAANVVYRVYYEGDCEATGTTDEGEVTTNATSVTLEGLCRGAVYLVNVSAYNPYGESADATTQARPVSPPVGVSALELVLNPLSIPNTTGNSMARLQWGLPLDTGDTADGVDIVDYRVYDLITGLVVYEGSDQFYDLQIAYGQTYRFGVAAKNNQGPDLGVFSAFGNTSTVGPIEVFPPAVMTVEYSSACAPFCEDPCLNSLRVFTPPQAAGGSMLCEACNGSSCKTSVPSPAGGACTEEVQDTCASGTCVTCEDPIMAVFVGSLSSFTIVAQMPPGTRPPPAETSLEDAGATMALGEGVVTVGDQTAMGQTAQSRFQVNITATADMLRREGVSGASDIPVCFIATTFQGLKSQLCLAVRVIGPAPVFRDLEEGGPERELRVGCAFTLGLQATDLTDYQVQTLPLDVVVAKQYLIRVATNGSTLMSSYRSTPSRSNPEGLTLRSPGVFMADNASDPFADPAALVDTTLAPPQNSFFVQLAWTPRRQQEGFRYHVCVEAEGYIQGSQVPSNAPTRFSCHTLHVLRCRFCSTQEAASLSSLASLWRAEWLSLWSGNHDLIAVEGGGEIQAGPVLKVGRGGGCLVGNSPAACGDDLQHISTRYGVSVSDLLWWNPDIADEAARSADYALLPDQEVCVLPNTCVNDAHIFSGGF